MTAATDSGLPDSFALALVERIERTFMSEHEKDSMDNSPILAAANPSLQDPANQMDAGKSHAAIRKAWREGYAAGVATINARVKALEIAVNRSVASETIPMAQTFVDFLLGPPEPKAD